MKTKRFLVILLVAMLALCLFSCKREGDEPENNYPDGAIALTAENLSTYFDIRVKTKCEYDYDYEQTDVSSFVALVPKGEYKEIVGEISFDLNARVRQYGLANGNWLVSNRTHTLRLKSSGVTNTEIKTSINGGGSGVLVEYAPIEENNNITLKSVYGYVINGEKKPQQHELITDSQRADSSAILAELKERVEAFEADYTSADSFNYLARTSYELGSVYGASMSEARTATHIGITVDKPNDRFKVRDVIYYTKNGIPLQQSLDPNGYVTVSRAGMTLDFAMEGYAPVWEIFDTGAVYIKENDNIYVAITTLKAMTGGTFKQRLLSQLEDYGITTRYDKMTVKYEYCFDESSLLFSATVDYTDLSYHVDYVDIYAQTVQKIADVSNTEIELYSPERYVYLPAKTLEDAIALGTAEITLKKGQQSFTLTTFSYEYEGWTDTPTKRYFPIVIEESGVYSFSSQGNPVHLYTADGGYVPVDVGTYINAGTYYLCELGVLYGREDRRINVTAIYLRDFGDVNNPTAIENGEYSGCFEAVGDRLAFSFTPDETGLYSLLKCDNVTLYLYLAADTSTVINEIWATDHSAILTAGEAYVILLEYRGHEPAEFTAKVEYVGTPTIADGFTLTEEWQEVFLWWDGVRRLPVTIAEPGEYYVEFEWIAGQEDLSGAFYTYDGQYCSHYKYVSINGEETRVMMLDAGEYYVDADVYANMYFKGRVRLVTYAKRVIEEGSLEIPTDSYVTVTTTDLKTTYSSASFTFEVLSDSVLYCTTDSDFFTIRDENGNRISLYANTVFDEEHGIWVEYSGKLTAGTYTIVFTIDEYATPGVKTAEVRLKAE